MKTLFLTGGSGEIGSAIAEKFSAQGYKVIAPRTQELNLADPDSMENYFIKNLSDIDVLIHSAGINSPKVLEELTFEDINSVFQINTASFYKLIQKFTPFLKAKKKGYILGISSLWSVMSRPGRLSYSMSKHAVNGLVQTMALELAPFNILVNALSPGFVDTAMTRANNSEAVIQNLITAVPLGRLALPEEIANLAYFLCSEENSYVTGQNIIIDGGITAGFVK